MVFITCPSHSVALGLSQPLVSGHLAACVTIIQGVTSVYQWQGALCEETEVLMMVKTTPQALEALTQYVLANHPYDCPEVVALPIVAGSVPYLEWVMQQTQHSPSPLNPPPLNNG
jgi:periplasmic divalent cation tolerance protein